MATGKFETEEEALIRDLLETEVDPSPPDDHAVYAEWCKDPSRYRAPPLWDVSHILCACDPFDLQSKAAALLRAKRLVATASKDGKSFASVAANHSDCGSRSSGGDLGQLGPGDTVPEFEAILRNLTEGEITPEPVLARYGWHIIRMNAVAPGVVLPFESVKPKIAEAMEKISWAISAKAFVDTLVASADITGADLKPI